MKPRSSFITMVAGLMVMLGVILWMLLEKYQAEERDAKTSRAFRTAKSETRGRGNDPIAAERAATKRAREALLEDPGLKALWAEYTMGNAVMMHLLRPFDPSGLRPMLEDVEGNEWEASDLLMRAGAEKFLGFQDLLAKPELRANRSMDMALCAYDYSVNGNREALERILEAYRATADDKGKGQWLDPAWRALEYVDEWDLVKQTLVSHPAVSGGESDTDPPLSFWLTRRYLFPMNRDFPEDYDRFKEDLAR